MDSSSESAAGNGIVNSSEESKSELSSPAHIENRAPTDLLSKVDLTPLTKSFIVSLVTSQNEQPLATSQFSMNLDESI